jgi:hypothetical protein
VAQTIAQLTRATWKFFFAPRRSVSLVVMFIIFSFLPACGVVVDNVACKAVERGERGDPWKVCDHLGIGLHRFHRCQVAPLRVDDDMALIVGRDKAGENPTIELADDTLCTLTQQFDELLLIIWLNGQDVDKGSDLFRHRNYRGHGVLLGNASFCVDTMKTIPKSKTDRSGKKQYGEQKQEFQLGPC